MLVEGFTMRRSLIAVLILTLAVILSPSVTAQELPGVNDERYVSPQFGYSLAWDEDWQAERSISRSGFDALVLANGVSEVVLSATTRYAGSTGFMATPQQCAQSSLRALTAKPGTTPVVLHDASDAPDADVRDIFWMEVTYNTADGMPMIAYVSCRHLGLSNGAMQTFMHLSPEAAYAEEKAVVDVLLETYAPPTLDLDQLDPGEWPRP